MDENGEGTPVVEPTPAPRRPRVGIAIPHGSDLGYHKFHHARHRLMLHTAAQNIEIAEISIDRMEVAKARIELVRAAIGGDCTHVFFMDDDMIHPMDGLLKLLAHDVPIISGLYFNRIWPHAPQVYHDAQEPWNKGKFWPYMLNLDDCAKEPIMEADVVGAGCLLIKAEVFANVPEPWFQFCDNLGEDFYFCVAARKAGYKVLVDTGVQCLHIGTHEIGADLWRQILPSVVIEKEAGRMPPVGVETPAQLGPFQKVGGVEDDAEVHGDGQAGPS